MTEVLLDSNAVQSLLNPEAGRVRRLLEEKILTRSIRVIGTVDVLEEIARIVHTNEPLYRQMVSLFFETVGPFILLPTDQRIALEVDRRGPLHGNCRFLPWVFCQELKRQMAAPAFAAEIGEAVYGAVTADKASAVSRRQAVLGAIRNQLGVKPSMLSTEYWANAEERVDDWVRDYIRACQAMLGLGSDESTWPLPRQLPTVWRMHAFLMTRMVLTVGLNRRIGDGDVYDSRHYASACYCDVLVSDDAALHETVTRAPAVPIRMLKFHEWSSTLATL